MDCTSYTDDNFVDTENIENYESKFAEQNDGSTQDWSLDTIICENCKKEIKPDLENTFTCDFCGFISERSAFDNNTTSRINFGISEKEKYENWGQLRDNNFSFLETAIDSGKKDSKLKDDASAKLQKLKFWQQKNHVYTSENKGLFELKNLLNKLNDLMILSKEVNEEIVKKYKKLIELGYTKGKGIKNLVGALVYLSAKELDLAVLLNELIDALSIKKKKLTKLYREIKTLLKSEVKDISISSLIAKFVEPLYLEKCNYIDIENEFLELKNLLYYDYYKDKSPILFVATCVFIILKKSHDKLTLDEYCKDTNLIKINIKSKLKLYYKKLAEQKEGKKFL